MNKHSKYRPILDKVQSQIMKAEIGVTGVYQVMLEALDEAETTEVALREELAESKENQAHAESRLARAKVELIDTREELAALRASVSNYRESKTTLHMYEMFDLIGDK